MIEDGGVPDLLFEAREKLKNPERGRAKFNDVLKALYKGLNEEPFETLMPWFAQGRDEPVGKFKVKKEIFGVFGDYKLQSRLEDERRQESARRHSGSSPDAR